MERDQEARLRHRATFHPDDQVAAKAMEELREKFDKTYFWCQDCDGLATTERECCLNIKPNTPLIPDWD